MQLTELELTNWGPFFGRHVIELSVDHNSPVIIFHGENMRGKTSLLRAIVWALYGEVREQDGRTPLDVARMVNLDALSDQSVDFGVRLKFTHAGAEYTLYRTSRATEVRPGKAQIDVPKVDLIVAGADPYPTAQIPDVIDGILARELSEFFLFDGEMLNRFEERLREERSGSQGFVRKQVERALGFPFLEQLDRDLDSILNGVTNEIDLVVRRAKAHNKDSDAYGAKKDELQSIETSLAEMRAREQALSVEIEDVEQQLAKVDEVREAFHRRKSLQKGVDDGVAEIKDCQVALAERMERNWWLPLGEQLLHDLQEVEAQLDAAEVAERERLQGEVRIHDIQRQLTSGTCPTCGQSVALDNEAELRAELERLQGQIRYHGAAEFSELRSRKDRLRKFTRAPAVLESVRNYELDIRRLKFQNDKREQEIRDITDSLSGPSVQIDVLDRRYSDLRATKQKFVSAISAQEVVRTQVKNEVMKLGAKLAERPEISEDQRRLQEVATEGVEIVRQSYNTFANAMRRRVQSATSDLFLRLTTEKEYSGVIISDDYHLALVDDEDRSIGMISAGANQILTMAFIGALGECSVDEAPMVMDTPFGRLDVGHRRAILDWVGTFDRQVILFVQSGEYDPARDGQALAGKIGREYRIDRLTASRSEVNLA